MACAKSLGVIPKLVEGILMILPAIECCNGNLN
jgi:hypothetical protein